MARAWVYEITTGGFYDGFPSVALVGSGYSGRGSSLNRADCVQRKAEGPIPPGLYRAGAARKHPTLGPQAIPLEPHPANEMFGRSAFYIHGDNSRLDRSASSGCIILMRSVRDQIAQGDLIVVVV